jgi:glycosyltransferase involved in cell wall biosynthesis
MANGIFEASAVCLGLFLHPYITYILSLWALRTAPLSLGSAPAPVSATLVFTAYNEQAALPHKIANLRAIQQACPDIEIIALSDGSSDDTVALLRQAGNIVRLIDSPQRLGKASGMRRMVREAHGEIVIFTDANVIVDPASIAPLLHYFTDPKVGGVAGSLRYVNEDAGATARAGGFYWRLEERIKQEESRVGSIMGADGSIFAIRRALYPQVPPDLLDDMTVSFSVTFAGFRLIHSTSVVACRAFHTHRYLWPRLVGSYGVLDRYKYISHKLLRWLGLVPLVLGVALTGAGLALTDHDRMLGLLLAGMMLFAIASRARLPGFGTLAQILMAILATFLGVTDALRGRKVHIWTPAASRN